MHRHIPAYTITLPLGQDALQYQQADLPWGLRIPLLLAIAAPWAYGVIHGAQALLAWWR